MKPKLVALVIDDHSETSGDTPWWTLADARKVKPTVIRAVGWIIKETKRYVVIVPQLDDSGHCGQPFVVMKSCITNRAALS